MSRLPGLIVLTLCGVAAVSAGIRGSADYGITAETMDGGGGAAVSASYGGVSSLGPVSGVTTAPAANATARTGYLAQLPEVTGLVLTAPGVGVAEGLQLQLAAWRMFDDGTRGSLHPATVGWSTVSGPATVGDSGWVTPAPVYQDSAAIVRGSAAGFAATLQVVVFNTAGDNYGSYAADGLRDDWQVHYFGIGNADAAPGRDPDHDGSNNALECAAGLVPTSGTSRFVMEVRAVPAQASWRQILFSPLHAGSTYEVQASTDRVHWNPLTDFTTSDSGAQRTVTDRSATTARKFYRVAVTSSETSFTYAGDGLPDDWQVQYFGIGNADAAPDCDPDDDGFGNAFEYAAGLVPTSAVSRFNLRVEAVPGQPAQRRIIFSPRYEGSTYTVLAGTDMVHWSPLTNFTTSDSGTQRTVTDLAAAGPETFYRVVVTKP